MAHPLISAYDSSPLFARITLASWLAVMALAAVPDAQAAGSFYVDAGSAACSDTGAGTAAVPYCTITAAVRARGGPATTIYVNPGTYREMVTVPMSGGAGSPFVLQAVGFPVIVDGADDFGSPSKWASATGSVYLAPTVTWSPLQVFADGARLAVSTAAPDALPSGSFVYVAGQGLYVNLGGANPGDHGLAVGRRLNGFRLPGRSWVVIDGFTVQRTEDNAITLLTGSNNAVLTHNSVRLANKQGINVSASSGARIEANVTSDNSGHGIYLVNGVSGSTILNNETFGNARPLVSASNGIQLFGSSGNMIQGNRIHDNQDSGLQISSGSNNNISLQNRSWRNGDHGYGHQGSSGTLHVGDVAWGNASDGFFISTGSTGTQIYDAIAAENGISSHHYALEVDAQSAPGFSSNFNIFWTSAAQPPVRFAGASYTALSAFAAATGQDVSSLQGDPRFSSPTTGDFRLVRGSPAIDSASSAVPSWPSADAAGQTRLDDPSVVDSGIGPVTYADRGALEFKPNQVPNATIDTPIADVTIHVDEAVAFTATGSDPDGDPLLAYLWTFGGGAAPVSMEDPGPVVFSVPGIFIVALQVTDSQGLADPTPDTRVITVLSNRPPSGSIDLPSGDIVVPTCQTVTFEATGTDPDGDLALSYHWTFGGAVPDREVEDPGPIVFPSSGTYIVTMTVTDSLGLSDPTPETLTVSVLGQTSTDGVHWTITGQTSVTLDWRGEQSTLHYGLTSAYDQSATGVSPSPLPISSCGPFRETRLTGLQENTLYHYAIGDGPDHTFRTPPPRGTTDFTVYAQGDVGDSQAYPNMLGVQSLIAADPPAFVLMVGDLTYANDHGLDAVDQHYNDVMMWSQDVAYMPAWGNHEWDSPGHCSLSTGTDCNVDKDCSPPEVCRSVGDDLRNYKGRFDLPNPRPSPGAPELGCCGEDWYWFDYGNVRFIAYPEPYGSNAWQAWSAEADALMDEAQADPAIRFIVSFGHRPAYSSGHHPGSDSLCTVLDALGASHSKYVLNLNGHSHNFERTFPLNGVIHVTDGGGGASLEQDGGCLYLTCVQPAWSAFRAMRLGPVRLQFSESKIEGSLICGPPGGGTNDLTCVPGTVVDRFTIPPEPPEGRIDSPAGNVTVLVGTALTFGSSCTDPNLYDPLTFVWDFGGGAPNATVEDPGPVVFSTPGTYTVRLTVTNSIGLPDPTPDTRTIVVRAPYGGPRPSATGDTE